MTIAEAFSLGADARIRGEPSIENPFLGVGGCDGLRLSRAWLRGWRHAQKEWAADAKPHHRVPPLPPLPVLTRPQPRRRIAT